MDTKKLRQKVLDLAIRGKLVPQNPNDEPASVLLKRIYAEKQKLISEGKIKREKRSSFIFKGEDNSYYEKIGGNGKETITYIMRRSVMKQSVFKKKFPLIFQKIGFGVGWGTFAL